MNFSIESAEKDDWPWIWQGSAEAVWASLSDERKREIGRETIEKHYKERAKTFQGYKGFPTMRSSPGTRSITISALSLWEKTIRKGLANLKVLYWTYLLQRNTVAVDWRKS